MMENRISELPEPILHNILSFLPTKDATKTSVLSKLWNSVWNSFPVLDFDLHYFLLCKGSKDPKISFNKLVQEFCKYVDDSIKRRRTDVSIQRFKLDVYLKHTGLKSRLEDIKRWIKYAVRYNVEHLVLNYFNHTKRKKERLYMLPMSSDLFHAKSLKELDLFGCKIVESGIRVELSLKKLKLGLVDIDDQTLQSLLTSCGSLEELTINQCIGFQSVTLSTDTLESVVLSLDTSEDQKIAIEAPNLQVLCYERGYVNVMRSLEASKFNENLKELRFQFVPITRAIITRVNRECRFLHKLELSWCSLASNIRLSDSSISYRTIDRLKNVEVVADCRSCHTRTNGRRDYIPSGLYKLEI